MLTLQAKWMRSILSIGKHHSPIILYTDADFASATRHVSILYRCWKVQRPQAIAPHLTESLDEALIKNIDVVSDSKGLNVR